MTMLGWIIWAMGLLLLVNGLWRLRKPKGRIFRVIKCLFTATALVVTAVTPFSKFHLLWILPLPILLGVLGFGLLAGGAVTYHKLTARKPAKPTLPAGSFPPFGTLKWSDYEWWEGEIRLPAWAGFQSRGGPYGARDSDSPSDGSAAVHVNPAPAPALLEPTEAQCRALAFQIEQGEVVVEAVLSALLTYYRDLKKTWEADDEHMPPVSSAADFRKHIGLNQVHVLSDVQDGLAYIGLEFGCTWDDEHGLGIVVHGARVVEIDDAQIAFSWSPPDRLEAESRSA